MDSVPKRPSDDQAERERRADAFLAQLPEPDLLDLADALSRLLISAARNDAEAES